MNILSILGEPLKWVLTFLNQILGNYALSILVFTIIVNGLMFPLNIKQQKTMAKQGRLKPKLDALKEKYGDDRMKYSTAMNELYQKEGVNPAGGCLPLLIRMPILLGVYDAVKSLAADPKVHLDLFGLNLAEQPKFSTNIIGDFKLIWLIPILSFATSLISAIISTNQSKRTNPQAAGNSMLMMVLLMPVFSLWIAFTVPGAVGFYWICSNVVVTTVQVIVNHLYSVDKIGAKIMAKDGFERRKKEQTKIKDAKRV